MSLRDDDLARAGGGVVFVGIFKNEASSITATLDSAAAVVDKVVIVDTGSTDGTPDIVRKWMTDNGVPGVVYVCPWPELAKAKGKPGALFDFAEARNLAQSLACEHVPAEHADKWFLFELDGCWFLRGGVAQLRTNLANTPPRVTGLEVDVRQPGTSLPYLRFRRVSNCWPMLPSGWRWVFPIHEALWRSDDVATARLHGVWIDHVDTTSKEARFARFERDLLVLADMATGAKAGLADAEPGTLEHARLSATLSRCAFYRGQTYENLGRAEEALAAYLERAALKGVVEDWAVALVRAGRLAFNLGDRAAAVRHWTEAHAIGGRPEPLWYAADALQALGDLVGSRQTAAMAFEAAKATSPKSFAQFVDTAAWALASFGPAQSAADAAARRLHMQLLGVGLPLDAEPAIRQAADHG